MIIVGSCCFFFRLNYFGMEFKDREIVGNIGGKKYIVYMD